MTMNNPWVKYIDRSYSTIKASINARLSTVVPELTDKSSSNLMQVLVDIFAGVGELLNYYIDTTARELYLPSARRFSSILSLAKLVGYNGKAAIPASTTVVLTRVGKISGDPVSLLTNVDIPVGFQFSDAQGFPWVNEKAAVFRAGNTSVALSVAQYEPILNEALGTTDGTINQQLLLPKTVGEGSLEVTINSLPWTRVEDMGFYGASDKVFYTAVLSDGRVYLIFGDNVNGLKPTAGQTVYINYHKTAGATGAAEVNTITTVVDQLPGGDPNDYEATNLEPAYGGKGIETIEDFRKAIPISTRTLSRAVTQKDYEDIATLAPGIRAARIGYTCGPRLTIYLVGQGGGNPSQALIDQAISYVQDKSVATIQLTGIPSGESHVKGGVTITGKFRAKASTIQTQVQEALIELYNPSTSNINQPVRISDIIATIDNVETVDYLTLTKLYVQPYLRPSNVASVLNYTIEVFQASSYITVWRLTYNGTTFAISKNGIDQGVTISVGVSQVIQVGSPGEDLLSILINTAPSNAINGDYWDFNVYPYYSDVLLSDLSIPVIGVNDFILSINETYTS